ncbi:metal cation symporter ZIP14-like [Mercenaria mercenaria]|uniref:metal cation symporter ZIP14-like n=1 Tax=Mercenaria mercenaria TaxID=6596 RepID=UPI00234E5648|nr:metal cation symporter ZIP14-like [Mercenaria mercenaria]
MKTFFLVWVTSVLGVHPHHDHRPPEFKYKDAGDFSRDFQHWIQSRMSNNSVNNIIEIVFERLGVYETDYCGNTPGAQSVAEVFKKSLVDYDTSKLLSDVTEIYTFFTRVLSVVVSADPCCQTPEDCILKAEEYMKTKTFSQVYEIITRKYKRLAPPVGMNANERLIYDVDTYANRFTCVDEKSLLRTVNINPDHEIVNEDRKRSVQSTVLIFYILKGYNLLRNDNEVCPGAYLHSIYRHYSRDHSAMSQYELSKLMQGLRYQPQHNVQSDKETGHIHSQGEKRQAPGFHPSPLDVENRFQEFHDKGPFDQGHRYLAPDHETIFLNYDTQCKECESNARQCFDSHQLISIFTGRPVSPHDKVPMALFLDMCPALLYKTLFKPCHHSQHPPHPPHRPTHTPSMVSTTTTTTSPSASMASKLNSSSTEETMPRYKSYLYGSLSVLVISLCSIVGAGFMKVSRTELKTYMMGSMLSLAVGCLVADAALHLLPEIIMSDEDLDSEELVPAYLRKLCAFLASIYAFFILELLLSIRHSHSHTLDMGSEQIKSISLEYRKDDNVILETNLSLNNRSTNARIPKTLNIDHENNTSMASNYSGHPTDSSIHVLEPRLSNPNQHNNASRTEPSRQVIESRCSNTSDRISIHDAESGVKALAWMIIIGDGIHNFADGLAIGAAFALTFTKGISTSITVLCHELPHELGDFAVLVSTGMSIKKAMLLNFVSSLTAFAGLYLGLALGEQEEASQWIFAVGAGMFLYVALTDLVPECKEYFKTKCTIKMFLGQNVGLLLGYVAMLLIAMYEDKLEIKA